MRPKRVVPLPENPICMSECLLLSPGLWILHIFITKHGKKGFTFCIHCCTMWHTLALLHALQFTDKEIKKQWLGNHILLIMPRFGFHWLKSQGQRRAHLLGVCCWDQGILCLSCSGNEIFTTDCCRCCTIKFAKGLNIERQFLSQP